VIDHRDAEEPWVEAQGPPPAPLGEVVDRLSSTRGWSRRLEGARVHGLWEEIAGSNLAEHTEPVRLHGGVLVVRATSSSWAAQLPYMANEIMRRANAVLGEGTVIRVVAARGPQRPAEEFP
jgi:predicted nucleic acid-binding Zn ribbon protein